MSSSDRNTKEASPQKNIKWYTQHFTIEWLKNPYFRGKAQKGTANEDLITVKCC